MKQSPKVSIVIPTYNGRATINDCLRSILNSDYSNIEVIVVDNASTDETPSIVRQGFPRVSLLCMRTNLGICGGRNAGAKYSTGEMILFVDQDNEVDSHAISILVDILERGDLGAVGPTICYRREPNRTWARGTRVSLFTGKVSFNHASRRHTALETMHADILPAPFLVRRDVAEGIGLFDERYFAVFEDSDFFHRMRKAGYKVACVPGAKAWHSIPTNEEETFSRLMSRSYFIARNRTLFVKRNGSTLQFLTFILLFSPAYTLYYSMQALKRHRIDWVKSYLVGARDGFTMQ